jgi:hypothetical protein
VGSLFVALQLCCVSGEFAGDGADPRSLVAREGALVRGGGLHRAPLPFFDDDFFDDDVDDDDIDDDRPHRLLMTGTVATWDIELPREMPVALLAAVYSNPPSEAEFHLRI